MHAPKQFQPTQEGMSPMKQHVLVAVVLCWLLKAGSCQDHVTIDTALGKLRGIVTMARNRDEFESFLGVPYAKPPLGSLRWEDPQPVEGWDGVMDATKHASNCLQQQFHRPGNADGSEDCLYVNVFTKTKVKADKHTLVWFHGGAFIFGGIDIYDPQFIMEQDDVILVTVQYRLNAFGFMSTEDSHLPGNYGMLDQVEALKWVQHNIKSFGGDPDQVTIFGMSAGGASVTYHTLSRLTKNLYKNSIALSGSPLCWWANVPHPRKQALQLAEHFDCPTGTDKRKEMMSCMRRVGGKKLVDAQSVLFFDWHLNTTEREPMNWFSPRSDPEREHPFLPLEPYAMLKSGDMNSMPHMMGYADKEGIWRANHLLPDAANGPVWADFLHNYDKVAPLAYGLTDGQTKDPDAVTREVTKFYHLDTDMREAKLTDEKVHNFIDVLSDTMFNYAIDETVKLRSKHKNMDTYYYLLTYPGQSTLANFANDGSYRRPPLKPLRSASHGTDMLLLFLMFPKHPPMSEKDVEVSRKFIRLLLDFGKRDQAPVDGWKPFDANDPTYLLMHEEFNVQKGLPMQSRMDFWNSLPPVYWRYRSMQGCTLQ